MGTCTCECDCDGHDKFSDPGAVYNVAMAIRDESRVIAPDTALYRKLRDWADQIIDALPDEYKPAAMTKRAIEAERSRRLRIAHEKHLIAAKAAVADTLGMELIASGWQPGIPMAPAP